MMFLDHSIMFYSSDMYLHNNLKCKMLLTRNIPRGSFYLKIANNNLFLTILLEIIITICKRQLLGSENIYLGPLVLEGSNGGGGSHILGGSETRTLKFPCSLFKGFLVGRYFKN